MKSTLYIFSKTLGHPLFCRKVVLVMFFGASGIVSAAPEYFDFGSGISVLPSVYYEMSYSDNLYLQPASTKQSGMEQSFGSSVSSLFQSNTLEIRNTTFVQEDIYDNSDYNFLAMGSSGSLNYNPVNRHLLEMQGKISRNQVERGTGRFSYGTVSGEKLDQYVDGALDASYYFGGTDSYFRFGLLSGLGVRNYYNNKSNTDELNFIKSTLGGRVDYRISGDTLLLFETIYTNIDYTSDEQSAKNKEAFLLTHLAGVSWNVTGNTVGTAKLGYSSRNFKTDGIDDKEGVAWDVNLSWTPDANMSLSVLTSSQFEESDIPGLTSYNRVYAVTFDRSLSVFYSVGSGFEYVEKDYSDKGSNESTYNYYVLIGYFPTRSFSVELKYDKRVRDLSLSNAQGQDLDYRKNSVMFGLNYAF